MRQNADNFLYSLTFYVGPVKKITLQQKKAAERPLLTKGNTLLPNMSKESLCFKIPEVGLDRKDLGTVLADRLFGQGLAHHPVHILNSPTVQFTATVDRIYTSNPGDWPKKHSYEPLPTAHIGLIIYQYMQQGILSKRVSTVSHQPSPQCPCRPHCHSSARSRRHSSKSCPLSRSSNSTCKKMVRLARSPEETY